MLLLLVAFSVPLIAVFWILTVQLGSKITLTERERLGVGFTMRNVELVRSLRSLRDSVELDHTVPPGERAAVDAALANLTQFDQGDGRSLGLSQSIAPLQADWQAAWAGGFPPGKVDLTLNEAVRLFDVLNARLQLSLDSDPVTTDLIHTLGVNLPTVDQRIDAAKMRLIAALNGKGKSSAERIAAAVSTGEGRHAWAIGSTDLTRAGRLDPQLAAVVAPVSQRLDAALARFIAISESDELHATDSRAAIAELRSSAAAVSSAVDDANHAIGTEVDRILSMRLENERRTLFLAQIERALAVIVGLGISLLIGRTVRERDRRDLERARRDAEQLSAELEQRRMLEMLAVTEAQFRAVFDRSSIGVAIVDRNGQVIRSNQALHDMFDPVAPERIGAAHPDFQRLLRGEIESFATELEAPQAGAVQWLEATHSLVRDDTSTPLFAIAMLKDVTERKRIDDRLRYEATHDSLSGLPNRSFFFDRVRATLFSEKPARGQHAVLFVDLDEFKFVNDSLGHAIGDRVLVAAAERLRQATGARDLVARFGGDEFAVLLEGRDTREEIERVVDRIVRELGQPLFVEGREIFVTASVGVAMYVSSYAAVEEILRDADTAMYYAKTAGRSRSAIFNATMHDQASRRLQIATQLRRALEREQVYLAFQPVVSLATSRIEAFETLLRWEHPELGLVSPGEFIPIAEEIGLIVPIGRWVVASSCEQLTRWRREGVMRRPVRLSVNASVREILQTDYCDFIEATVQRFGLQPGDLVLEVTESAVLASGKFSSNTLERIKAAGVGLAIDDFGTGYSSLRYLQQFPFDELKIDRSFVSGTDGKLASEAIVTMLLSLGKAFGVGVVAEGVETAAQAARLRALGCTAAQGYFYGAPIRAQAVEELLRREQSFAS